VKQSQGPSNPLALAVLVLLFERPMHPYEIGATLKMRRMEKSIKFRYGSLYTVIEGLQKEGWIAAKETIRDGRRPERTIYEITPAGLTRMRTWLREMLGTPIKEYPQFEAALSLLPAIPPAEAVTLLEGRSRRLGAIAEEIRVVIEVVTKTVEPLFLVENEYRLAIVEAERQFIDGLLRRIADDEGYTRTWKGIHQSAPERDSSHS
jgi:DNA-binding PadR family transcriptional regulator